MSAREPRVDPTEERLSTLRIPPGAAWAERVRMDARERVLALGLPGRRDEYWKYTRPESLTDPEVARAAVLVPYEATLFDSVDRLRIVFIDGVFAPDLSDDLSLSGVHVERLCEVSRMDIHWASELYGVLEARSHSPIARPLAALNTAYATDGVMIHVTEKATKPVNLMYLHRSETSDAILHHCVKLEEGADLTLLETGPAAARFNKSMEIDIADGAAFHHVRAQGRDHERRAMTHTFARLGRESVFKSFTVTVNGVLTRNECVVELVGPDAVAHVAGAVVGDGEFHHDDTVLVTHDAAGCRSRQVFKKVLRNGATGVFQGKILVRPGAQKTDGYQISQSLLLDDDAQFYAKPELEIYADDVQCSHGSTSGAIDEEALYYLRSRGIPRTEAQDMLVLAFLAEAIDEIEDGALARDIVAAVEAWLGRRRG
ncbi:MAG: Fe-S cluster assembly protein SufD [Rhodobacter sp.]|nr:Fe-S cluster assembly protein SufD [Rhodobacter sp.]MCY4168244.1 Fe-S cluster assembly protein SufD [Rhodobacter sp.]MCY4240210.1 Fe-S cluster assembly protein SufD [Rhodobacter sp.]